MAGSRLVYALMLLGGALFHVFYTGYFSFYVLVLIVIFPFFSLAVSLPGMLCCSLELSADRPEIRRGETAECGITFRSKGIPVARAWARLEGTNLLTGRRWTFRKQFSGGAVVHAEESVEGDHCGVVRFRMETFKVCDLLGLFTLRRKTKQGVVEVLVRPEELPAQPVPELAGRREEGTRLTPRPGGGPGEDYDLRAYRPGDPLRAVHWKLSSKLDELVVRETLEIREAVLLVTFDRCGTPEDLDYILGQLEAVSSWLLEQGRAHYVQWLEPGERGLRQRQVRNGRELTECLRAACSTRAPGKLPSLMDAAAHVEGADETVRRLHLTPRQGEEGSGG